MPTLSKRARFLLYAIVLFEGYVVLASELLAIRLLMPFVGSGTEIIAIVISAVLMPLAIGYHAGARRYAAAVSAHHAMPQHPFPTVRRILLRNILISLAILGVGLSQVFLEIFFSIMQQMDVLRIWQAILYVCVFLVTPVFLLAQTVPLISHYFRGTALNTHTGRMLFFSTAGSFLGSIFSTLILMNVIGVHGTTVVTMGLLTLAGFFVLHSIIRYEGLVLVLFFACIAYTNSPEMMKNMNFIGNNSYNLISVRDIPHEPGNRLLSLNHAYSSIYADSKFSQSPDQRAGYIAYVEDQFIYTMPAEPKREILVLGAGGFTVGLHDTQHHYDFVDIDPSLKDVVEEHFLKQKLSPNKNFIPLSARAFLRKNTKQYDLIFVDTYSNAFSIPMECTTVEFMEALKKALKPGGIVVSNVIGRPHFDEAFTVRYSNSFAHVFGSFYTQIIGRFKPWQRNAENHSNMLFVYIDSDMAADNTIYTDSLNTYSLDR